MSKVFRKIAAIFAALAAATLASVGQADAGYRAVAGVFQIYGGELGDPVAASKKDAKIAFSIKGQAAIEMFNAMGPDAKDSCTQGSGTRVRKKDNENLVCLRFAEGLYSCRFGFDLKSGRSIGGSLC
ncbi:hypothetical protein KY495_07050 [Massilia sp. PAMC28688]|uniref:hypothetical protein n=1 Tax=Massilia sp. PAMC28688 TaxID=2861283 RepID=UPI001C638937|nr:hypothetical protein [Massilia sp. PAMC28688]QYF94926.1 hypothetical protein KY495_07050 [Massilia sp. PAMC28688]